MLLCALLKALDAKLALMDGRGTSQKCQPQYIPIGGGGGSGMSESMYHRQSGQISPSQASPLRASYSISKPWSTVAPEASSELFLSTPMVALPQ